MANGGFEDVGGHIYLDRKVLEVHLIRSQRLPEFFRAFKGDKVVYVMAVARPLSDDVRGSVQREGWSLEQKQSIQPWPNLKKKRRRYIYRASK